MCIRDSTAFVHEVNDQLQFVQALEVGHFRRVASFNQGFKTGFNQFNGTAAQNGLFAEQVGFGLVLEGGFDDAGTTATHTVRSEFVKGGGIPDLIAIYQDASGNAKNVARPTLLVSVAVVPASSKPPSRTRLKPTLSLIHI